MSTTSPFRGETNAPANDAALQQELRAQIEPGERLLWSGYPRQGVILRAQDLFMVPFSLMWGGFAMFWEYSVIQADGPLIMKLWGIPFVLVGLWLIFGRFFTDAWLRGRTVYGVTNRRVLIISGFARRQVRSLQLLGLAELNNSENADGSGTITFGAGPAFNAVRGWPMSNQYMTPAFEGIPNVRDVLQTIRNAQRSATSDRS
jgi:hypothetical protein